MATKQRSAKDLYRMLIQARLSILGFLSYHKYRYSQTFKRKLFIWEESARRLSYEPGRIQTRRSK
ncbi:MAG: hypothetical protein AB7T49_05115 [Oligoflexales bacterium]